jgi:hypothetical protein
MYIDKSSNDLFSVKTNNSNFHTFEDVTLFNFNYLIQSIYQNR